MGDKNKVVQNSELMFLISHLLINSIFNPTVTCKVIKDDEVVEETFILDDGATNILKAYYKSKLK